MTIWQDWEALWRADRQVYRPDIDGPYEAWLTNVSDYVHRTVVDDDGEAWTEWRAPGVSKEQADAWAAELLGDEQ
jgi:hypothetical protein